MISDWVELFIIMVFYVKEEEKNYKFAFIELFTNKQLWLTESLSYVKK